MSKRRKVHPEEWIGGERRGKRERERESLWWPIERKEKSRLTHSHGPITGSARVYIYDVCVVCVCAHICAASIGLTEKSKRAGAGGIVRRKNRPVDERKINGYRVRMTMSEARLSEEIFFWLELGAM